jgi:predicted Zn-dependent peptidase
MPQTATCWRWAVAVAASFLLSTAALAAKPKKPPPPAPAVEAPWPLPPPLQLARFRLANGLRAVVHTDRTAPLIAVGLLVDVGARDEEPGLTGLAHFFEHMMFQGSKRAGKMEHLRLVEGAGGDLNAHTTSDYTYFYETVPKQALDLVLWLESDRFARLDLRPSNVDNQRAAVLEERRQRYEDRPHAAGEVELPKLAFAGPALQHSVIGEVQDLQKAPTAAFQQFFESWYVPGNVVVVLSGDVTVEEARPLLEKHFGRLAAREVKKRAAFEEPEPASHVYGVADEKLAKTPAFHLAWKVPPVTHPDTYVLDVVAHALAGGDASRLERLLVRDRALATAYWAGTHGRRDIDLFEVFVELADASPAAVAEAKKRVREALFDMARNGLPDAELRRAKIAFETGYVFGSLQAGRRAELLALHELWFDDAAKVQDALPRYRAIASGDIQRVVRSLLTWDREVELDLAPSGMTLPAAGARPQHVTAHLDAMAAADAAAKAQQEADAKRRVDDAAMAAAAQEAAEKKRVEAEAKAAAKAEAEAKKKAAAEAKAAAKAEAAAAKKAKAAAVDAPGAVTPAALPAAATPEARAP